MNNGHTRATVKRIEKIPSQFYVQAPEHKAIVRKRVKVEVADSLLAGHKRLTDALHFAPPLATDYSGSWTAVYKSCFSRAKAALASGLSAFGCLLRENAKRLAFSGAVSAGVAAMAFAVLVSTCSIGCMITVNGQTIGIAENEEVYQQIVEEINHEISYVSEKDFVSAEPEFSTCLIPKGDYSDTADMKEQLKATSSDMLPAYAVSAEEEILFALPNEQTALSVLEEYKAEFTGGNPDIQAEFCEPVTVSHCFVPKSALKTAESAAQTLSDGRITVHQLAEGETLSSVAADFGITVENLLQTNPITNPEEPETTQLKIFTGEPLLSVKTVERKTLEEEIPYETIETDDPTQYEGKIIVEQEGVPGARVVDAYVTSVNGVETERQVISENTLSAAVDKIVHRGTKEPPSPIGTGELAIPASGSLSSRFGSRWGRSHTGIDLAANVGTDVYAADNGTVIYSQYNDGGYGYLIQIDHGNGIITYYGHCSELLVPAGTVVAKGDLIAKVGNTGRSTGAHLHFEVRVNGSPTDPLAYLNGLN